MTRCYVTLARLSRTHIYQTGKAIACNTPTAIRMQQLPAGQPFILFSINYLLDEMMAHHVRYLQTSAFVCSNSTLKLQQTLLAALEMANHNVIEESANQLLLESDPVSRKPKSYYVLNYLKIAQTQLSCAFSDIDQVRTLVGDDEWHKILNTNKSFRIMLADGQLATDKINAAIAKVVEKE